jgi:hypothetical protein
LLLLLWRRRDFQGKEFEFDTGVGVGGFEVSRFRRRRAEDEPMKKEKVEEGKR